jgi:hypothetical protein
MRRTAVKLSNLLLLLAASCTYNMDPQGLRERINSLEAVQAQHQAELQAVEQRQQTQEQRLNTLLRK